MAVLKIKRCVGVPIVIPRVVFGSCLCLIPSMSVCGSFENPSSSPDLNTLDSIVRESFPEDGLEGMPV
mgnify:CR=1 FL=1